MKKIKLNSNENKLYIGKWTSKIGNVVFDYVNTISIVNLSNVGSIFLAVYQSSEVIISVIFNLIGGVVADGNNKKKLLVITDLLSGFVSLILSFFVNSSFVVFLMILANILLSIIGSYNSPIYRSIVREMIQKEKIGNYNAVSNAGFQIVSIVSPLFALFLVRRFNVQIALLFNALTFFVSAFMEIFLKPLDDNMVICAKKKFLNNLIDGIKYLVLQKEIFLLILLASVVNFFLAGYNLCVPNTCLLLKDISKHIYTIILVVEALGGILGSYLSVRITAKSENKKRHFILCAVGISFCVIPYFCETKSVVLCIMPFFVATLCMSMFNVGFVTSMQTQIDSNYLGRVFSIIFALSAMLMPVGSFVFTYIIKKFGLRTFNFVGGGVLVSNLIFGLIFFYKDKMNDVAKY